MCIPLFVDKINTVFFFSPYQVFVTSTARKEIYFGMCEHLSCFKWNRFSLFKEYLNSNFTFELSDFWHGSFTHNYDHRRKSLLMKVVGVVGVVAVIALLPGIICIIILTTITVPIHIILHLKRVWINQNHHILRLYSRIHLCYGVCRMITYSQMFGKRDLIYINVNNLMLGPVLTWIHRWIMASPINIYLFTIPTLMQ